MKHVPIIAAVVIGVFLFLFLLEATSSMPHYVKEPAVILRTGPDTCGWIGTDEETVVRFTDGYTETKPRWLGHIGDHISVDRQHGTTTIFHLLERDDQ